YSEEELESMISYTREVHILGIRQFVFGALHLDFTLDLKTIGKICNAFPDSEFTIHKAIDCCTDPVAEIRRLKCIDNVKYVLSSGGQATAMEGAEVLKRMAEAGLPEIGVIAAGKVTKANLAEVHGAIGVEIYHGRKIV